MSAVETVWVERVKWADHPHYAHDAVLLSQDDDGAWVGLTPGRPVYRGEQVLFVSSGMGGVVRIPRGRGWMAWFAFERDFELYVDIVTPPTFAGTRIAMVDLDLDVVRWPDGRVELVDEDEFEEHQVRYGYPQDVIDHAVATAAEVLAAVTDRVAPFDAPPQPVLDAFLALGLYPVANQEIEYWWS